MYEKLISLYKMKSTGCPKKLLESGAHKTSIRDTFTWCAGCSHMGFSFLSRKQPIIHVLSEVMRRKTVESNCFVIILRYQSTVSFLIETILSVFISAVKYLWQHVKTRQHSKIFCYYWDWVDLWSTSLLIIKHQPANYKSCFLSEERLFNVIVEFE